MAKAPKPKKRKYGQRDNLWSFARQFTLAHIGCGADAAHDYVEPAWDGHRMLATRSGTDTRLAAFVGRGLHPDGSAADGQRGVEDFRDWTQTFPLIARSLGKLAATQLAIDGVVCVLDERGAPSYERLRAAVARTNHVTSAVLICWDLLWDGEEDLRMLPLAERRARLAKLLVGAPQPLMPSEALPRTVKRVMVAAKELGLRGVVARSQKGDYAATWHAHAVAEPIDFRRSLSPPPPLSNADKVLYPRDAICKRDIVGYYRDIAPVILPYLLDRPAVIQRWPDGIDELDWYQHRMPPRAPDYIRAAWVDGVRRIVIENGDALLWLVNQAGLTYHAFGSRLTTIAEPDWAMIDLDPGNRTSWFAEMIEVALAVRRTLELLELPSVVKTSGQRGLHIMVPLAPGHAFADAEAFGRGIAMLLLGVMPDKVTIENEKGKRFGRLLVDHKQFMAKTLVAPYSLRAADGATVSTPISWAEVTPKLDPKTFTLKTLRARLDKVGDLAAPLVDKRAGVSLAAALAQLRHQ